MGLLNLTVCLLMIIALAEAKVQCKSSCEKDVTAEGEDVTFTCQVPHVADRTPVPQLTWHHNNWNGKEEPGAQDQRQEGGNIVRRITLKAAAPDLQKLACLEKINDAPNSNCDTEPCEMLYSVRKVTTSLQLFASPGEQITCKAEGNPEPKFYWQVKSEHGIWVNIPDATSETFEAPELNNGTSIELRCAAMNTVKSRVHIDHSVPVTVTKDGAFIRSVIIGVVVAVVVIVIIVVVIIQFNCPGVLPWN